VQSYFVLLIFVQLFCFFILNLSPKARSSCLESVQKLALPLEGVDDIHGGHGLPVAVLRVGDRITNEISEVHPENCTRFVID